jgi:hypothetical protein
MPVIDKILFKGISCVLSTQIGWHCAAISAKKDGFN